MKLLFCIAYRGTNYHGSQVQENAPTVQKQFQDALERVFCMRPPVTGCSRTDAGVHALRYYCTAELPDCNLPVQRIPAIVQKALPRDIAVLGVQPVPDDFHPRYAVIEKEYEYRISNTSTPNPFLAELALWEPRPLRVDVMQEAATLLQGRHDFTSFMASGSKITDPVREIRSFTVTREQTQLHIRVSADGFLYHMVRILAGTLLEVSFGKRSPGSMPALLAAKDRSLAGFTAPAGGLYLARVAYDPRFAIQI